MPKKKASAGKQIPGKKTSKRASTKKQVTKPLKKVKAKNQRSLNDNGERVNHALQAAHIGVWEYDLVADVIEWSDNVHNLFGLPRSSFDGTLETFINLIHPADRERMTKTIDYAIDHAQAFDVEYRIVGPDGAMRWFESIGKIMVNKKHQPVKMTGTVQDISKKKVIEHEREDWKTRHELVSKSAGLVIYDYNIPTGEIVWSGNSLDVLGYKPKELGNIDRWILLIHPEDRDEAFAQLEKAEEELKPYDVTYRFSKRSGEYCYMHDRGFFIADYNGKAYRMLGVMNDISERVAAEQLIKENNRFRESIEQALPDILYVFDIKKQEIVYINKRNQKGLGYDEKDFEKMGKDLLKHIVHPDDLNSIPEWTREEKGDVKEMELRIRRKDGNYYWIATRNTPFKWDKDGNVTQIIGIAQDVTVRKQVVTQLQESERSYRELFNTVGDAIYIQDKDGRFVDVNKGICTMYGYEKHEFIGMDVHFISAEGKNDFQSIEYKVNEAFKGKTQVFEFWGKKKRGDEILMEIRLTKGSYFGKDMIIATGRDITQRRNTEQALRDSEQRFRTLQRASFGGIGLHDKGTIIDCNQGLCDLTGYSYEELIGFNGLMLIAPDWRSFVIEKIQSGYEKTYDVEGVRKDGTRYMLEIQGKNIPYEGRMIRVTEFRDITNRKKSEEKILEQNSKLLSLTDDLLRKNEQLEEFTQIVSHNLRSPVGNIVTLLNFLEGSASEQERKEYLDLLKESAATTLYMLNDLNEVLKIKQNKNIEKQQLVFEDVLELVKSMLSAKISQKSAEITYHFAAPSILYPGIYLESILLNLLDNALKYAHPKRNPKVEFKTYVNKEGNVILEVKDNGLGLNIEKYGHHIFKLRKTFHRHPESRGIGLFMIKNQIEAMGGEITMTSKENEGSTFFINFNKNQHDGL